MGIEDLRYHDLRREAACLKQDSV
ncbi:hypothetical protein EaACW_3348 [Erwinia amylovora ACW56400]|uniref:Uncharacterized protein n=1 Tax=Erwinia amylovora NBRC 12687 = CFBP 1232 TaxID=1219359 RepID=A0A831ESK5_ERWAM|nr:hypothetical protein EaACW_3348 [Erwinia amylovora ACW56400]CCO80185.1 hypothetical protein BN432_3416 [Erwinia amylovora Ea356]CCO83989.1 hypothetical protein BN433_3442 [Erwinia amylovora Ea266]CCO87751.1 hypothetical protein BN434_3392 [Erwinia amylovora CFBP 2585]CCO91542.1 hypothetical protein BN435_3400 [Erwinia amylovora 01SFR-BO]CCO95337.1 hypothetical protein BN437_3437 [Erwinia amylovora NBRC 12687 = CFBP 1232]CCP00657.1 hypothetical protein BN438_3402 [Erwinia amylovora UPN527]